MNHIAIIVAVLIATIPAIMGILLLFGILLAII